MLNYTNQQQGIIPNMQSRSDEPFNIVEKFTEHRRAGKSPRDAWGAVKKEFIQESTASDPEQAWKTASGRAFEKVIRGEFEKQIKDCGLSGEIGIQQWEDIKNDLVKRILSDTLWSRCTLDEPYEVGSQVDFIAIEKRGEQVVRVLSVYSCKVSLRERFQQDLYWAEKLRGRGVRFCFITLDNDGILLRDLEGGELRSKQSKMAAALYDRIYLLTDKEIQHCKRVFRTIDQLGEDLKRWLQAD